MGLRFKKSIKILPGVSINISKTGVSATIGPKGKSINVGTNGIFGNLGLGKGVSYRKKRGDVLPKNAGTAGFKRLLKIVMLVVIAAYLICKWTDLFVAGAVFCAVAFLVYFRCKKKLYYGITIGMAVLIWAAFRFGLGVRF